MITLLDYGVDNVRSVINAIENLGETVKPVKSWNDILAAEKLVFIEIFLIKQEIIL